MTKAWILVGIVVAATVAADALQSYEMKRQGEIRIRGSRLRQLAASLARKKCLILSTLCMAISFFAFMTLLSQADLSFAVPASAATFVIETILARFVLRERVDFRRWVGAALVAGGVALLAV
ncbi:MAG TPA: EamA family transporter [Bryobacteraceae bacterium]|nr:EamA family transporter [Bryobacteraceae bacterium]